MNRLGWGGDGALAYPTSDATLPSPTSATPLATPDLVPATLTDPNRIVDTVDYTITNAKDVSNYVTAADIDITSTWVEPVTPNSNPQCAPADFSINGAATSSTANDATDNTGGGVSESLRPVMICPPPEQATEN